MKVSLNTIKQYVDVNLTVDELVHKINQQLGGVEEVIDLGATYADAMIVRVVECEKHPNADKLNVCLIDDSHVRSGVERDENGLVRVVCGAPNARAGMFAVWLPPKSTVPSTYDDKEPFVLDSRELRGIVSHGMLASAKELAIGDDHDGIVDITEYDFQHEVRMDELTGKSFAEVFGLNDHIIDIENKMFTHRPDLFGQLGVAREIYAILGGASNQDMKDDDTRFVNPDWYWSMPEFTAGNDSLQLNVFNETPEKSSRFMAVAINDIHVMPSPLWLRTTLVRWGSKSINNIVDLTNYIMLLTAQPTHAYDYDKLRGNTIGVRMARSDEKVTLLNGKQYSLTTDDIVIADGEGAVGLAGIMGGGDSEVSSDTTRIVLEVASFDMYTLRKSSMRHGIFTDALTRFNKGQSHLQNNRVMSKLLELIPGQQASQVFDLPDTTNQLDEVSVHGEVVVGIGFINQRLGLNLTYNQIGSLLRRANFAVYPVEEDSDKLSVTAPFFRTDIELPEDIVEEVGRLYGFDKLPRELPRRTMNAAPDNVSLSTETLIRDTLRRYGANEVLTYSFVHEKIITKAEQDVTQAFKLSNALSPDLQYYRLSVLPSLLDKVHGNIKSGHDEFMLYEIGKGHNKKYHGDDDEGLPSELRFVDMVYASKKAGDGSAFYMARQYVEKLASAFGRDIVCLPITEALDYPVTAPFDLERSALVHVADTNEFLGMIGEFKQSVMKNFKLPAYSAGITLDFAAFEVLKSEPVNAYKPLSRFPSVTQDVSLAVDEATPYEDVYSTAKAAIATQADDSYAWTLSPVTIYQAEGSEQKVITLRLNVVSYESSLTDSDVKQFIDHIVSATADTYGAVQR